MNHLVDAYFETLRSKRVTVLGLGVSNRPLVRMLLDYGCRVTACDKTPRERLETEVLDLEKDGAVLHLGESYLQNLEADVVFRTPGLHPDCPELLALRKKGAVITSEMEAFFAVCPCKTIAVTGSDGKTTTTTLIAELLKQAGKTVWLGGNIGTPLLPQAAQMAPEDYAVVELSSFQLMYFAYSPQIAVVTNLAPNHLDIHKDMAEYVAAKENVFLHQDAGGTLVVNMDNEITAGFAAKAKGQVYQFSRKSIPAAGVYLKDGMIRQRARQGEDRAVLAQKDILLPGIHNVENYMAAIAAVSGIVSDAQIQAVARNFGGVEHRIELVRVKDGVSYYNDSIASSPSRTIAGLRSFEKPVILIAGGYDKHIPYDVLGPEICDHVKLLIVTGDTGGKIRDAAVASENYDPNNLEILEIDDFYETIRVAANRAKSGDVVLLSPASAAFDRFKNFMVRGEEFKKAVRNL